MKATVISLLSKKSLSEVSEMKRGWHQVKTIILYHFNIQLECFICSDHHFFLGDFLETRFFKYKFIIPGFNSSKA